MNVATFTFVLTLEFTIRTLVTVVRQARLVAVECGPTVTGTLAVTGSPEPLRRVERTTDLPLVLDLGAGIALPTGPGPERATG